MEADLDVISKARAALDAWHREDDELLAAAMAALQTALCLYDHEGAGNEEGDRT